MSQPVTTAWFDRPAARAWRQPPPSGDALAFHVQLPGYAPSALTELPSIADELGAGRVFVKDESARLGLPAFKILGVSWAVCRAIAHREGQPIPPTLAGLRNALAGQPPITLATATDGNHGRALARMAALIGARAQIFVPRVLPAKVIAAIEREGASVTVVDGSYDEAVLISADWADVAPDRLLIQDTAWPGYEEIPTWIVEGYGTLFHEVDAQLAEAGAGSPDLLVVPTGVGSLLQAALAHYRRDSLTRAPAVLSVEPELAACVLASVQRGELTTISTTDTVMAGLNCGLPSSLAWPMIQQGLDAAVAIDDQSALRAMRDLHAWSVPAGPCGAAALAGARVALAPPARRAALAIGSDATLVLISTEGIASGAASTT